MGPSSSGTDQKSAVGEDLHALTQRWSGGVFSSVLPKQPHCLSRFTSLHHPPLPCHLTVRGVILSAAVLLQLGLQKCA